METEKKCGLECEDVAAKRRVKVLEAASSNFLAGDAT
jgi:hypothetical protein